MYDETNCLNILMNRPNMLLLMYNSNMSKHIIIIDNFSRHYLKEDITHSKCNIYQDINQDIISLDNYEYYYIYIKISKSRDYCCTLKLYSLANENDLQCRFFFGYVGEYYEFFTLKNPTQHYLQKSICNILVH